MGGDRRAGLEFPRVDASLAVSWRSVRRLFAKGSFTPDFIATQTQNAKTAVDRRDNRVSSVRQCFSFHPSPPRKDPRICSRKNTDEMQFGEVWKKSKIKGRFQARLSHQQGKESISTSVPPERLLASKTCQVLR